MAAPDGLEDGRQRAGALPSLEDPEARLLDSPEATSDDRCRGGQAALRRSALGLGCLAAGACAAVLLCQLQWGRPAPSTALLTGTSFSRLWDPSQESGPCPPNRLCQGTGCGIPRNPLFYTVGQAFHCLDTNGDGELSQKEIENSGRGNGRTGRLEASDALQTQVARHGGLSYFWFQDGVRRYRDAMFDLEPVVGTKLLHWVEHVLKMMPGIHVDTNQTYPPLITPVDLSVGVVHKVYTFGAPAVSTKSLWNGARTDRCFSGIRVYNTGNEYITKYQIRLRISDPLSWIFTQLGFVHPRTSALSLEDDDGTRQGFSKCGYGPTWLGPRSDMFFWFEGHRPTAYEDNLKELSELIDPGTNAALEWESDAGPAGNGTLHASLYSGDRAMLKDDATAVRHEFDLHNLQWNNTLMQDQMGKPLRILRVRRPGVVLVQRLGGAPAARWDCPTGALRLLRPASTVEAGPAGAHASVYRPGRGAADVDAKKREQLARIREAAHLAFLGGSGVPDIHADLHDKGWTLVAHAVEKSITASLLQRDESLGCTLIFGLEHISIHSPLFTRASSDVAALGNKFHHTNQDRLVQSLLYIYTMFAGTTEHLNQRKSNFVNGQRRWRYPFTRHIFGENASAGALSALLDSVTEVKDTVPFCGFDGVQYHFAHWTREITASSAFAKQIRPRLPGCKRVTAVGHGIGGALATLWAACANSGLQEGKAGYEDYKHITWRKGAVHKQSPLVKSAKTGVVIKDASAGREAGVGMVGKLSAVEVGQGAVQLTPYSQEGWEQKWELTPEGLLKNERSGRCVGVESYRKGEALGSGVQMQACKAGYPSRDQHWRLTPSHVLVHRFTGRCLSAAMTLERCPLTDQRWHLTSEGFIVNRISGKCMDVRGSPGLDDGDPLVQWPCEYDQPRTDQLWEVTRSGQIRNRLSGKCMEIDNVQAKSHGVFHQPTLVLWSCATENTTYEHNQNWAWTSNGYVMNTNAGKCIDVGGKKQDGSHLTLKSCERTFPMSSAMWSLTEDKQLVNIGRGFGIKNKCLTASSKTENTTLALRSCETRMRHNWEFHADGHIETEIGINQCITAQGSKVGLSRCNQSDSDQIWNLTEDGFIINGRTRHCINIQPHDLTLRQEPCRMLDQRWMIRPSGAIMSRLSGLCIDVKGMPPEDKRAGAPLAVWECEFDEGAGPAAAESITDQLWEITQDKMIRNKLSGHCVDEETRLDDASRLVMQPCNTSLQSQHWELNIDGYFRNRLSRKCIDVEGTPGQNKGQPMVTNPCKDSRDFNQRWSFAKVDTGHPVLPALPFGASYPWTPAATPAVSSATV